MTGLSRKIVFEELAGEPKKPENTAEIIKTSRILRKRYGRVYLNIGEQIVMKDYLAAQEKPIEQMTLEKGRPSIEKSVTKLFWK